MKDIMYKQFINLLVKGKMIIWHLIVITASDNIYIYFTFITRKDFWAKTLSIGPLEIIQGAVIILESDEYVQKGRKA